MLTYTGSAITLYSASVPGPGRLNQSLTLSYQNNTNTGTATANASEPSHGSAILSTTNCR